MFSKSCEYGIRATLFIAQNSLTGKRVSLKDTAEQIGSPQAFTAKVLQQLSRNNIIHSTKGPNGGFEMDKDKLKQLSLMDVVTSIDGNKMFTECALGLRECNAKIPCPLHHKFGKVRNDLKEMLESSSLEYMAGNLEKGLAWLKC